MWKDRKEGYFYKAALNVQQGWWWGMLRPQHGHRKGAKADLNVKNQAVLGKCPEKDQGAVGLQAVLCASATVPQDVHRWLIHADVWQKPIQHCKAIIFQLKIS